MIAQGKTKEKLQLLIRTLRKNRNKEIMLRNRAKPADVLNGMFNRMVLEDQDHTSALDIREQDYAHYTIRPIPLGKKCYITSDGSRVAIMFNNKKKLSVFKIPNIHTFSLKAIYSHKDHTYYITELLTYQNFSYRGINSHVRDYFLASRFKTAEFLTHEAFRIRFLREQAFSMNTLKLVLREYKDTSKCVEVISKNTQLDNFMIYNENLKNYVNLKLCLGYNGKSFVAGDGLFVLPEKQNKTRKAGLVYQINIKSKHVGLFLDYLEDLENKHTNTLFVEEELEFTRFWPNKKVNKPAMTFNELLNATRKHYDDFTQFTKIELA